MAFVLTLSKPSFHSFLINANGVDQRYSPKTAVSYLGQAEWFFSIYLTNKTWTQSDMEKL